MSEVTQLLEGFGRGDARAVRELLPLLYDELRSLAASQLSKEKPGQTLQATALVHEAFLRLVGDGPEASWENRGHFFAAAAEAMRRILVDRARAKSCLKRGGDRKRIDLEQAELVVLVPPDELLAFDEALDKLAAEAPVTAEVVKLKCFADLSLDEIASHLTISTRMVSKHWAYARARLFKMLH